MKHQSQRIILVVTFALMASNFDTLVAGDNIQTAGDVLQFVLPVTAAGLTLGYRDGPGALQLGESLAVTMGVSRARAKSPKNC